MELNNADYADYSSQHENNYSQKLRDDTMMH